jgi:hypothetical protein
MARKKESPESVRRRLEIAERLRAVRDEFWGPRDGSVCARELRVPARSWYGYETGCNAPAEVLLRVITLTGVSPAWLMDGTGPMFAGVLRVRRLILREKRVMEARIYEETDGGFQWELWTDEGHRLARSDSTFATAAVCRDAFATFCGDTMSATIVDETIPIPSANGSDLH